MNIKCGIIGFPNIGKSTLFSILTKKKCIIKNYPFSTINPNKGYTKFKYKKLYNIANICINKIFKWPKLQIIDIPGIIKNSYVGKGLGNNIFKYIKKSNILIHIIGIFNYQNKFNKNKQQKNKIKKEIKNINNEILLYDLITLENNINNININKNIIKKCIQHIEKYNYIKINKFNKNEFQKINILNLISLKPKIYILNIKKKIKKNIINKKIYKYIKDINHKKYIFTLNIKKYFNKKINKKNIKLYNIKKLCFKLTKKQFFFTINKLESRIWIINKKTTSHKAAKLIHSDFNKKFIKSQVISYKNFIKYKGWNNCKEKGKLLIKNKNYIIKNGDIIKILINK